MNEVMIAKAMQANKIFQVGYSFLFAAQIPDDSVGISGSHCSNCGEETAYCDQICQHCKLPFVGPFGFPQLPVWESLKSDEKRRLVEEIYCNYSNKGRLVYVNVTHMPLTREELREVEKLQSSDADYFLSTHEVSIQEIRSVLAYLNQRIPLY